MRALALLKVLAACVAVAATSACGGGSTEWLTFRTNAVSVRYPPGWHATARRLTPVTSPPQVLAVASFPFPQDTGANGCAPEGTLAKMPRGGALIFLIEYGGGGIRARDFPPRPQRFRLTGFANYECFGPSYLLGYRDAGRFFQVAVMFRRRSADTTATVLRILDSFYVTRR